MLAQRVFDSISHLIFSRWARDYEEHHGSCESAYAARLGFLHLEINRCIVLEHDDAYVGIRLPTLHRQDGCWRRGQLYLGYRICLGAEQVRDTGFCSFWSRPLLRRCSAQVPKIVSGQNYPPDGDDYFPF